MVRKLLPVTCLVLGALGATAAAAAGGDGETAATAAGGGAACRPYGPIESRRYDPALFVAKMHQVYNGKVEEPMIVAHRGVWGEISPTENIPENSMQAIKKAGELRMESVELDIHIAGTATDQNALVLMHDYTVGRTTDAGVGSHEWDPVWAGINSNLTDTASIATMQVFDPAPAIVGVATTSSGTANGARTTTLRASNGELRALSPTLVRGMRLYAFKKNTTHVLGVFRIPVPDSTQPVATIRTVTAYGEYVRTEEHVPSLLDALNYIGGNFPGMTVILDLRHLDEVTAALNTIDAVRTCDGRPGREWIILKPFANIFPGGWDLGTGVSVMGTYGARAEQYLWIPVMSNRLVMEGSPGAWSKITGYGPDQRQLTIGTVGYLQNWMHAGRQLAGTELGSLAGLAEARSLQASLGWRNMTSWRPSDLQSDVVPDAGYGVLAFNWKDDGLGIYPTTVTSLYDTTKDNGAVIIEDVPEYLSRVRSETPKWLARQKMLQEISKIVPGPR